MTEAIIFVAYGILIAYWGATALLSWKVIRKYRREPAFKLLTELKK